MKRYSLALLALFLVPLAASAADLPVSYTVDAKALKLAVAGTNVTFDLYTDSACTGPIAHTETIAIENVDIIAALKLFAPKGALVKPPKTDELRHTLTGVSTLGNLYLKVTGTGVTPVSGACQAQYAHAEDGQLPTVTATIRFAANSFGIWGMENPVPPGFQNSSNIVVASERATLALNGLGTTSHYSCNLETDPKTGIPGTDANYYIVFDVRNCTNLCTDGLKNSGETDIDCGGSTPCPRCVAGKTCGSGSDCTSNVCSGSVCQP